VVLLQAEKETVGELVHTTSTRHPGRKTLRTKGRTPHNRAAVVF